MAGRGRTLTDYGWADRMAMPATFIQAVGQPTSAAFMQSFTCWRWGPVNRQAWTTKVIMEMGIAHPGGFGPIATARKAFYRALYEKCMNLYGPESGDNADRLALLRHPWTLNSDKFYNAYETIKSHKVPSNDIVPDQNKWSTTVAIVGLIPTAAGIVLGMVPGDAIAAGAIGLPGLALAGAGLLNDAATTNRDNRQDAQIRANYRGYVDIYERERIYRQKATMSV